MDDVIERLRELAEGLAFEHFEGPPVDPFLLAERMGVEVVRGGAVARWRVEGEGRSVVHLPRELASDRARFTLAHELVEIAGAKASPPLQVSRDQAPRAEQLFQLGASDLLMPRRWFAEVGEETDWDLAELRDRFQVSWEAAARRVPVCVPAICTVVDNGRTTARAGSEGLSYPRRLAAEEREAIAAAYEGWPAAEPARRRGAGFTCVAWPALPERNAIRRVCLLTYPEE
jgi:predicted transcriptional regulator